MKANITIVTGHQQFEFADVRSIERNKEAGFDLTFKKSNECTVKVTGK